MNKVIITGASGFIGKALVKRLKKENLELIVLVRNQQQADYFKQLDVECVIGDVCDKSSLMNLPSADTMYHLAGVLDHSKGEDFLNEVNITGTANILEVCQSKHIKRLVYLSTLAVIANGDELFNVDEHYPLPNKNIGAYATSKAEAEKLLLNVANQDVEIVVVRPPFVWGNGDNFSLPKIIDSIKKHIFSWIENGNYPFATCHVENLAEGLYLAGNYGENKNVYIIQDGENTTIREFLSQILSTQNIQVPTKNTSRKTLKLICTIFELPWKILPLKSNPPTHLRETLVLMGLPVTIKSDKAKYGLKYKPVMSRKKGIELMKVNRQDLLK